MKELPLIRNTEMVKAILEGRKTQTRRPMKPRPKGEFHHMDVVGQVVFTSGDVVKSPFGQPGDVLYVRETHRWFDALLETDQDGVHSGWQYFASTHGVDEYKWKPSINMPKDAARIWLKVKRVWVERVQDISEEDARAEGAVDPNLGIHGIEQYKAGFRDFIWTRIYPGSWGRNEWVRACEFEVLSTTGKPEER